MSPDRSEEQLAATNSLIDEIKALRDGSEELLILLEHIWQNREDLRFKFSVIVNDGDREAIAETLCCYECDVESPASLAQALHDGWIDISCADAEHGTNYVGWCPDCQHAHEEEERRLNTGPVHPLAVKETGPAPEQAKPSTPTPNAARNSITGELQSNTVTEHTVESLPEESSPSASDSLSEAEPGSAQGDQHGHDVLPYSGAVSAPHTIVNSPSEDYRKNTPLLTRMYLQRHMADIVRAIGYECLPRDAALERIRPLIERYGRDTVEPAVNELLETAAGNSSAMVRLRDHVRLLARQMLGPPPEATSIANAGGAATVTQSGVNETDGRARFSRGKRKSKALASISKLGSLQAVKFTRKEMLLEFREHLEKQGIQFEQIDNVTRSQYTDKHVGALDFIIRATGEPPELVAIRRKLTTTQLHDLAEWQKIIGDSATVSVVWMYVDDAGRTSWEVASGETDGGPTEEAAD